MFNLPAQENADGEFAFRLEHASQGDSAVLNDLIKFYAEEVFWLIDSLLRIMGVHLPADDITRLTAIVFQRRWNKLDQFHGEVSVSHWLYKETIEQLLRILKKKHISTQHPPSVSPLLMRLSGLPGINFDIPEQINITRLNAKERVIFFLRYAVNLDTQEIAQVSLMRPGDVDKLLIEIRNNIGLLSYNQKNELLTGCSQVLTQADLNARSEGDSFTEWIDHESLRAHILYCPDCQKTINQLQSMDEIIFKACQEQWPRPVLTSNQMQNIFWQVNQMQREVKPWSKYYRHLRDAALLGFVTLIIIIMGAYFSSQDQGSSALFASPNGRATPTVIPITEVTISKLPELERAVFGDYEHRNQEDWQRLYFIDNDTKPAYTRYRSDESVSTNCLSISPLDDLIATCSHIGRVNLWSIEEQSVIYSMKGSGIPVTKVSFSPDGSIIAAGYHDGTIILWHTQNGSELAKFTDIAVEVLSVAFSPDGRTLSVGAISASWILEFDEGKFNYINYFPYPGEFVNNVAYSSDGKFIAHAISDGSIWIRRTSNGKIIARLDGHDDNILKVAFSPNGSYLASGSGNGVVNLWHLQQLPLKQPQFTRLLELHHASWIDDLAFSPDEQLLAVAAHRKRLAIWQIPSGIFLPNFEQNLTDRVNGVAFSSDGEYLATGSMVGGIRIWRENQP